MDWQSILVAFLVLAALAFVGRRGWMRLQSVMKTKPGVTSSCASACGGCASQNRVPEDKRKYQILDNTKSAR